MVSAALHPFEAERLADLRSLGVLDTPREERFDRFVRLARQVFNVPIAYVAMVDENRQWFKAESGLELCSTSRDTSFCSHTILQPGPLVIDDATLDPRFADNPLVTRDPHIRFYAGHPLRGPSGHNIGTLCIADTRPRSFTPAELETFRELALATERELNMTDLIEAQRRALEATTAMVQARDRLASELSDAAAYVRSLIPSPIRTGQVRTDWAYTPSSILGGDILGYQWLDDRRFAFYLIDVCGHGVASALLSTSVVSTLRRGAAAGLNLADPAHTLTALNRLFPMEEHGGRFFTAWYGVFDRTTGELAYASGGHPPAIILASEDGRREPLIESVGEPAYLLGIDPDATYDARTRRIRPSDALYVFSDGVYETRMPGGRMLERDGLSRLIAHAARPAELSLPILSRPPLASAPAGSSRVARVVDQIKDLRGTPEFEDDFTLLEIEFDE